MPQDSFRELSQKLLQELEYNEQLKVYAKVDDVLKFVGSGLLLAGLVTVPGLGRAVKRYGDLSNPNPYQRFNLGKLKQTLRRLESQKLVEIIESAPDEYPSIVITEQGETRILKMALDEVQIKKPHKWNNKWHLVSYDIDKSHSNERYALLHYLKTWGFIKMHDSLYLHAYPCLNETEYLRQYLKVGDMVRFFIVDDFEGSQAYKKYFDI